MHLHNLGEAAAAATGEAGVESQHHSDVHRLGQQPADAINTAVAKNKIAAEQPTVFFINLQ